MDDVVKPTPSTINPFIEVTIMVKEGCNGKCFTECPFGVRVCNGVFEVRIKDGNEFSLPVCSHCSQQTVLACADPRNQAGIEGNWIPEQDSPVPPFITQEPPLALEGQQVVRDAAGQISAVLPGEVALCVYLTSAEGQNISDRFDG